MEKQDLLNKIDWEEGCLFLLECGKANTPDDFAQRVIDGIGEFIPYDTASVYLMDGSGKICSHYLRGVDERWNKIYLAYYIHTDNERYNLFQKRDITPETGRMRLNVYDWEKQTSPEFVPDFVRARGLLHTCGFGFEDMNKKLRVTFALDRTHPEPFREEEILLLHFILPHLSNLHKNFYYQVSQPSHIHIAVEEGTLTARESQIAELLCQSMSPAQISQHLHIAQSTTYKHIANIYAKLNVSSQRQLLAKLLKAK